MLAAAASLLLRMDDGLTQIGQQLGVKRGEGNHVNFDLD